MKSFFNETLITLILVGLLFLVANPFDLLMPEQFEMYCTALITAFFVVFVISVIRDKANDEREELHQFIGARFAYLFGAGILVSGIIIQALMHDLSFWLPLALGGMLAAKLLGKWYAQKNY